MINVIAGGVGFFVGLGMGADPLGLTGLVQSVTGLMSKIPLDLTAALPYIVGAAYILVGAMVVKKGMKAEGYGWVKTGLVGLLVGVGLASFGLVE